MAFLLADKNVPAPTVFTLCQHGHDVLTLLDLDKAGLAIPDDEVDEVLALATSSGRCLITQNRKDFIKLHEIQPLHAGILICTVDNNFIALAERITNALRNSEEPLTGLLLRVQRPQQ